MNLLNIVDTPPAFAMDKSAFEPEADKCAFSGNLPEAFSLNTLNPLSVEGGDTIVSVM